MLSKKHIIVTLLAITTWCNPITVVNLSRYKETFWLYANGDPVVEFSLFAGEIIRMPKHGTKEIRHFRNKFSGGTETVRAEIMTNDDVFFFGDEVKPSSMVKDYKLSCRLKVMLLSQDLYPMRY